MIIRPTGAAPRPEPKKDSLEELARDVLDTGAEIRAPRKWWFGTRALTAEKTAEELRKQNPGLTVAQPGCELRLPLKSQEDLTELAAFRAARPLTEVAHPELARAVLSLEETGFGLVDELHRPLSLYGAYNAVTDPAHELGPLKATLADREVQVDQGNLTQLSAFYASDPLGRLEIDGYEFFDEKGERRFAFGATAPAMVGENGEAWLKAAGPELRERLEEFALLRKETGDLSMAQQIAGLTAESFASQAAGLVGHEQALPGVCRAARKLSTEKLLDLAGTLPLNDRARQGWLEILEERPETEVAARLGSLMLASLQTSEGRDRAFASVLARPRMKTGAEAAELFARVGEECPGLALQELQKFPDTAVAAGAVAAWCSDDPGPLAQELLKNPTDGSDAALVKMALEHCDEYSHDLQGRILADMGTRSERARIGADVHGSLRQNGFEVFRASLESPEVATGAEAAQLLRKLAGDLPACDRYGYETGREGAARVALETLQRFPDTAEAARQVAAWGLERPFGVVGQLLKNPTDSRPESLRELARNIQGDASAQRRVLETLPTQARRLHEAASYRETQDAIFQSALAHPELPDGKTAAGMMRAFTKALDESYYDGDAVAPTMLEVLREFPDTKPAADRVAGWQSELVYPLVKALLTETDITRVAAQVAPEDFKGQQGILEDLKLPLASELWARMQTDTGRKSVVEAALRHPRVRTGAEAAAFLSDVAQACAGYDRQYDRGVVGAYVLEKLQTFPDTRPAAARVAAWATTTPFEMAQALLENPTDSSPGAIRALASRLDRWDHEAQRKVLEELKAEVALPLFDALGYEKHAAFQAALKHPEIQSGAEAAVLFSETRKRFESDRYSRDYDEDPLARQALAALGRFPDTEKAAAQVAALQAQNPVPLVAALLENPTDASPAAMRAIARLADPDDAELYRRILEPARGTPAADAGLKLLERAMYADTRKGILTAVLAHHDARTGPEVAAMLSDVRIEEYDGAPVGEACLEVLQGYPETRAAAAVVKGWSASQPWPLIQKLLKNPEDASPAALRAVAAEVTDDDSLGQEAILTWLAADPASSAAARVAQAVYDKLRLGSARADVVQGALTHAELESGADAAALLKEVARGLDREPGYWVDADRAALASEALGQLEQFPDTAATARAISGWQLGIPYPVVRKVLDRPTDASPEALHRLGKELDAMDEIGQRNLLGKLAAQPATQKAAELGLQLMDRAEYGDGQRVLNAVLEHHSVANGAEAAALLRDAWFEGAAPIALGELQNHADTRAAADRIQSWKAQYPAEMIKQLLENPTDASVENLRRVAARATETDPSFNLGVLGGLAEPANRDLGQTVLKHLHTAEGYRIWNAAVLESPPVRTGAEASALLGKALASFAQDDWTHRGDVDGLARAAGAALARYPDTAAAAARFEKWGELTPAQTRLKLWLGDVTLARPDFLQRAAGVVAPHDAPMQKDLLDDLGGTTALMTRAAMDEVQYEETRFGLFKAALELGETRGTQDVERFFALAKEHGADYEQARLAELEEIYKMSFGMQGRSSDTLAEEENRVLVGGVVVKKKD